MLPTSRIGKLLIGSAMVGGTGSLAYYNRRPLKAIKTGYKYKLKLLKTEPITFSDVMQPNKFQEMSAEVKEFNQIHDESKFVRLLFPFKIDLLNMFLFTKEKNPFHKALSYSPFSAFYKHLNLTPDDIITNLFQYDVLVDNTDFGTLVKFGSTPIKKYIENSSHTKKIQYAQQFLNSIDTSSPDVDKVLEDILWFKQIGSDFSTLKLTYTSTFDVRIIAGLVECGFNTANIVEVL